MNVLNSFLPSHVLSTKLHDEIENECQTKPAVNAAAIVPLMLAKSAIGIDGLTTARILHCLPIIRRQKILIQVFLYGTQEEEIYMKDPEGFIIPRKKEEVCHLVNCLYGLKWATHVWNVKFNEFISFGIENFKCDPCIYYCHLGPGAPDEETTFFILYVGDSLILSNYNAVLLEMIEFLGKAFEIPSLPADRLIGVNIERNHTQLTIHFSKPDYIKIVLARFSMTNCNSISFPADPRVKLSLSMFPRTKEEKIPVANVPLLCIQLI